MGLFDRFRRKPAVAALTPAQLFAALREALVAGDGSGFESLCRQHTAAIVAAFPGWQKPGAKPEDLETTIQVLGATARFLDEVLGEPEPWRLLTRPDDNPFVRWEGARQRIMQRLEVIDYVGAVAQTVELLADIDTCSGPGRDQQAELTRGMLGQLLRQVGRADEAVPHLEWTLAACEAHGDDEGVGVYLRQLHEADRDRGRPSAWALRLAAHLEAHGDADEAARLRGVARRYPEGEPLLRMVVAIEGRRFELDEAELIEGREAQVLFERSRDLLAPARQWTERGREHGGADRPEDAIACFVAAAAADPHDPDSRYLHAFTLMHMNRPDLALPRYDEVERLAPGWFHARTWRSLAQRRLAGSLTHEVVTLIDLLQDGGLAAEQRLQICSQAIQKWPRVPELFLYRGEALAALGRDPESAWRAGLELADANALPAIRSRLLHALGRLEEVVALEGANLMAVAAARLQLRLQARV